MMALQSLEVSMECGQPEIRTLLLRKKKEIKKQNKKKQVARKCQEGLATLTRTTTENNITTPPTYGVEGDGMAEMA